MKILKSKNTISKKYFSFKKTSNIKTSRNEFFVITPWGYKKLLVITPWAYKVQKIPKKHIFSI